MKNILDFHVRFLRLFFGIGFGMELLRQCDDACKLEWWAIHCKVFIGPVVIYWTVPLRKSDFSVTGKTTETTGKVNKDETCYFSKGRAVLIFIGLLTGLAGYVYLLQFDWTQLWLLYVYLGAFVLLFLYAIWLTAVILAWRSPKAKGK